MKPSTQRNLENFEEKEELTSTETRPLLRLVKNGPSGRASVEPIAELPAPDAAPTSVFRVTPRKRRQPALILLAAALFLSGYAASEWLNGHGRLSPGEHALVDGLGALVTSASAKPAKRPDALLALARSAGRRR